jgi:hypothetical protein
MFGATLKWCGSAPLVLNYKMNSKIILENYIYFAPIQTYLAKKKRAGNTQKPLIRSEFFL